MHLSSLIHDLAVILGVAAIVTFVFQRIKQPVVLGYILAGLVWLVGPDRKKKILTEYFQGTGE